MVTSGEDDVVRSAGDAAPLAGATTTLTAPEPKGAAPSEEPPPARYLPASSGGGFFTRMVEGRSPRAFLGTIVIAVVVSLLAGYLVGQEIERHRGAHKTRPPAAARAAATRNARAARLRAARARSRLLVQRQLRAASRPGLIGKIFNVRPRRLVVVRSRRAVYSLKLTPRSQYLAAPRQSTAASLVPGVKVVYTLRPGTQTAWEIVVLPSGSGLGRPVAAVVPGVSMTLRVGSRSVVVPTRGAVYDLAHYSVRQVLSLKHEVIVRQFRPRRARRAIALESVVLPRGTTFF